MAGRRYIVSMALILALVFCAGAAQAEKIPVYLPENAQALSLPELPEPPVLTGWQESEDASGRVYTATFSSPVDQVTVHFGGETEEAAVSQDGLSAAVRTAGADRRTGLTARRGDLRVFYTPSDNIRYIELTESRDVFLTGQRGAASTIRWENFVLDTPLGQYRHWFIASVTGTYVKSSYITSVTARFRGDKAGTLTEYEIVYAPRADETYTIRYSAADNFVSGLYRSGKVTLRNGSGRYFWENAWFDAQTGRRVDRPGLAAFTSFTTPRVKTGPAK